jgi:hypothetical protein
MRLIHMRGCSRSQQEGLAKLDREHPLDDGIEPTGSLATSNGSTLPEDCPKFTRCPRNARLSSEPWNVSFPTES